MIKIILYTLTLLFVSCSGTPPQNIGLSRTSSTGNTKTTLKPCPESPNCITSYIHNNDRGHYMPPITFDDFTAKVRKKVLKYLNEHSRIKVVKSTDSYIYAEVTSLVFRFVDDLELYFESEGVLHFRSASRIGYSDLGVNKSHITSIKKIIKDRF